MTKISRGTAVHHPHHGIGRVQSIGTRSFSSSNDDQYAQLYFQREALTLILPMQDLANTVRNPITAKQARQIVAHIETWEGRASKRWKSRAAAHQAAMERGDPFEYAEIYKALSRLEADGSLRHTDRAHLNRATDFLADELSYVLGKTPDQVRQMIAEAANGA